MYEKTINILAYCVGFLFAVFFAVLVSITWVQLGHTWGNDLGASIHALALCGFLGYLFLKWK